MAMKLAAYPFDLRLLHPFTTSHNTKTIQRTLLLSLEEGGIVGYGEAAESPIYGITTEDMCRELAALKCFIEDTKWHTPEELHTAVNKTGRLSTFSLCALDIAMHDWYGKSKQKKLYELWGIPHGESLVSSFTIGMDTPRMMRKKMAEVPWPLYKIKVGKQTDMKTLALLRQHTRAFFGWMRIAAGRKKRS